MRPASLAAYKASSALLSEASGVSLTGRHSATPMLTVHLAMPSGAALSPFNMFPFKPNELKIMKITEQDVERVAALARLELSEEEIERLTPQLDHILSYVAKLDELDTEGVPVTTHTQSVTNAFREDEVRDSLPREKALANTAQENGEAFVVPKVVG